MDEKAPSRVRGGELNPHVRTHTRPHPLGWLVPTTARIPVLLAEVPDADWHLEPDELDF